MFAARATLGFHKAADKTPVASKAAEAENLDFISSGRMLAACPQVNHEKSLMENTGSVIPLRTRHCQTFW
jgi:hypothetical protein